MTTDETTAVQPAGRYGVVTCGGWLGTPSATFWPGPTPDGVDVPGELINRFPLGTQVVVAGQAPAVVTGLLQVGGGRLNVVAHTSDGRRWTAPVGDILSLRESPDAEVLVPVGPGRRYRRRAPRERVVVDGRRGEVVGTETSYAVRLEDGQYVLLSRDAHRAAVERAQTEAEPVRRALDRRVAVGTVVEPPLTYEGLIMGSHSSDDKQDPGLVKPHPDGAGPQPTGQGKRRKSEDDNSGNESGNSK